MFGIIKEIIAYRELLLSLAIRDIKIRYKQAILGFAWAIFTPLVMMLIFALISRAQILKIDTGGIPYAIFAYCGLLPWTFFAGSLTTATTCLVSNRNLVTKIYFPREVFPLSAILSKFVDFCVAAVVLAGLMFFYHIEWQITLVALPAVLLIQVIFMVGLSFLLSMGNLFYRDVKYIFDVVILLWMFATSVIYPIKANSPVLQKALMLNPMTPIIDSYRDIIIRGVWPNMGNLWPAIIVSLALFFIGTLWFHKSEYLFAENI